MKGLVVFCVLTISSIESLRQSAPIRRVYSSSSESSMSSSEEDSFEQIEPIKTGKKENLVDTFFNRPSVEDLEAYDQKVKMENKNRSKPKDQVNVQPVKGKMDPSEENAFLLALDQMYLDMMAEQETNKQNQNMGPVQQPVDYDYMVVPVADQSKNTANNNGNNNVHVNVNHVQLNQNILQTPKKSGTDRPDHPPPPPPAPQIVYTEPVSTAKYFYLNLNMTDGLVLAILVVAIVMASKKVYTRCFPKTQSPPQLPTSLPPTYTPSTIVVESATKKVVPP